MALDLGFWGNHRGIAFVPSPSGNKLLMVVERKLLPPNKDSAPQGYKSQPLPWDSPPPEAALPPSLLQTHTPSSSYACFLDFI